MSDEKSVTIEDAVELLNELLSLDREATLSLIEARVPCNDAVADHPTVTVQADEPPVFGLLGVLNGLFSSATQLIVLSTDEDAGPKFVVRDPASPSVAGLAEEESDGDESGV